MSLVKLPENYRTERRSATAQNMAVIRGEPSLICMMIRVRGHLSQLDRTRSSSVLKDLVERSKQSAPNKFSCRYLTSIKKTSKKVINTAFFDKLSPKSSAKTISTRILSQLKRPCESTFATEADSNGELDRAEI